MSHRRPWWTDLLSGSVFRMKTFSRRCSRLSFRALLTQHIKIPQEVSHFQTQAATRLDSTRRSRKTPANVIGSDNSVDVCSVCSIWMEPWCVLHLCVLLWFRLEHTRAIKLGTFPNGLKRDRIWLWIDSVNQVIRICRELYRLSVRIIRFDE